MKKFIKKIHDNRFYILILIFTLIIIGIYLSEVSSNVPYSDYWYYIDRLVDKSFKNGVSFMDLYYGNGVHHTPIQLLLFLINVKFFSLNSQISLFLGCLMIIPISLVMYKELKSVFLGSKKNSKFLFYLAVFLTIIFSNTLNQWEIMSNEFYFPFQLRLFFFIISFIFVSNMLINKDKYSVYAVELAFLFSIVIVFLSGAYFAAYVGSIILVMSIDFILEKSKKDYYKLYLYLLVGLALGSYIYLSTISDSSTIISISFSWLIDFFKATFIMMGASLTGVYSSTGFTIGVGLIMFIFQIVSVFIFFKKKMYLKTYVPLILILYSFCICGEIYLGRTGDYGLSYLASSRYTCETLWFSVADVWILLYDFRIDKRNKLIVIFNSIIVVFVASTFALWFNSNKHEWNMAKYRKQFYSNLNESILKIDTMSDEELSSFVVEPSIIRKDVMLMKKYKLGVFRNDYYLYDFRINDKLIISEEE